MTYFTGEQVNLLLKPIHPKRVNVRDGMSYVEGYDIKAELNRVFGFGRWSAEILDQTLIAETETKTRNNKDAWYVVYRTSLRLTVKAPDGSTVCFYDESHVGESTHPVRGEAHGNALTNSWTYALKRCATNLGDQFGLSLYGKGSMDALVRWTLIRPEAEASVVDDSDVPQVTPEAPEVHGAPVAEVPPAAAQPPAQVNGNGKISRPAAKANVHAPADAETDIDWMGHLVDDLIPAAMTRKELTGFWGNVDEHVAAGECTDEHAKQIKAVVTERARVLGFEKAAAA